MVEGRRVEARLDASRRGLGEIMAFPIVRWVAYRTPTIVWPQLSFNLRLPTVELRSCRYETLQGYGTHGVVSRMKDPISCTSYHKARCLYKYCSKSFIPYLTQVHDLATTNTTDPPKLTSTIARLSPVANPPIIHEMSEARIYLSGPPEKPGILLFSTLDVIDTVPDSIAMAFNRW